MVGVACDHAVDHTVGFDLQVQHDDLLTDAPRLDSDPGMCDQWSRVQIQQSTYSRMNSVERRLTLEDAIGQRRRWVLKPGGGIGNATNK